jgi:hypothetical protein
MMRFAVLVLARLYTVASARNRFLETPGCFAGSS